MTAVHYRVKRSHIRITQNHLLVVVHKISTPHSNLYFLIRDFTL